MAQHLKDKAKRILYHLRKNNEKCYLYEFSWGDGKVGQDNARQILFRLVKKGLVKADKIPLHGVNNKYSVRAMYYLTDEGKRVADEIVNKIDELKTWGNERSYRPKRKIAKTKKEPTPEVPIESLPGEGIVLADFYAEWCEPCKRMEPVILMLKQDFKGRGVYFVEVDVEKSKKLASQYKANMLPTLLVLKDGVELERHIGYTNVTILKKGLESALDMAANCKDGVCQIPLRRYCNILSL